MQITTLLSELRKKADCLLCSVLLKVVFHSLEGGRGAKLSDATKERIRATVQASILPTSGERAAHKVE